MKNRVATAARLGCKAALAIGLAALASLSVAQTVPDQEVPATGLDLPANLQIFGKADPNIRKPTAIVNDTVITGTDVDQRVAWIVGINQLKLSPEDLTRLRLQSLRTLIDETLQIQEAVANKIEIERAEIDQSFGNVAQRFNRTPDQFRTWLRQVGSSERSIKRLIEGELAWSRLLRRRVPVEVSDAEVNQILERLRADKGTDEYRVFEIYLNAPPERVDEVFAAEQRMIEQLRQGTPFETIARSMSEATTRVTGGDLGWVRAPMLPQPLAEVLRTMEINQVAGPIEVPGGFSILFLQDKRKVLEADARDARLNLKQMTIRFDPGATQAEATNKAAEFARATQAMQGCGDVARAAGTIGADVVDNDQMRVRDLPGPLQSMILDLQIGQASQPFGSLEDGVRVLVLCGRDDPEALNEPTAEQISSRITEERVNMRAQRMLRDLRRDALVEYR